MRDITFFGSENTPTVLNYMTEELPFGNSNKREISTLFLPNRADSDNSLRYRDVLEKISNENDLIKDLPIKLWDGNKFEIADIINDFRANKARNIIIWGLGYRKEDLLYLFDQGKFKETVVNAGYLQQLENGTATMVKNPYFNPNLMNGLIFD